MARFREALQYASQNPDSEFATELRRRIEGGLMDNEAMQEGIDLRSFRSQNNIQPQSPSAALASGYSQNQPVRPKKSFGQKALETTAAIGDVFLPLQETITQAGLLDDSAGSRVLRGVTDVLTLGGASHAREDVKKAEQAQKDKDASLRRLVAHIHEKQFDGEDITPLVNTYKQLSGQDFNVAEILPATQKSTRQVVGEGIQTAATVAGFKLPTVGFKQGLGTGLAKAFGQGALLSGTTAFGYGLAEDKDTADALADAVLPAVVGGGIMATTYLGARVVNHLMTKTPEKLYQSAFKQSNDDLIKEARNVTPKLSKQLLNEGVAGSEHKIIVDSVAGLNASERQIQQIVRNADDLPGVNTRAIVGSLDDVAERKLNVFGKEGANVIREAQKNLLKRGDMISVQDALRLKRDIYKELANSAFKMDATLGEKAEALRTVAAALNKGIANSSDELAALTKQQQMWERALQAIELRYANTSRANIVGLHDTILAASGIDPNSVGTLLAGVGRRFFETTRFKTGTGIFLKRANDLMGKLPKNIKVNLTAPVLSNMLKYLSGGNPQTPQSPAPLPPEEDINIQ